MKNSPNDILAAYLTTSLRHEPDRWTFDQAWKRGDGLTLIAGPHNVAVIHRDTPEHMARLTGRHCDTVKKQLGKLKALKEQESARKILGAIGKAY